MIWHVQKGRWAGGLGGGVGFMSYKNREKKLRSDNFPLLSLPPSPLLTPTYSLNPFSIYSLSFPFKISLSLFLSIKKFLSSSA